MVRPRKTVPAYERQKSGYARCRINGKEYWLGKAETPESRQRYADLLRQLQEGNLGKEPEVESSSEEATISQVCLRFVVEEFPRYRRPDGKQSAECDCYKGVIRILRETFGETPVNEFGPLRFRKVRQAMIAQGWSRGFINKQCGRLRHLMRWGVSWELVPGRVADDLKAIAPLRPGETTAPETAPRRAVSMEHIETIKKGMRQKTRDLIDLLLYTGARPAELLSLLTRDIVQVAPVWKASLEHHKNRWRGQDRTLYLGPKAQLILRKYLNPFDPEARLFKSTRHTLTQCIIKACEREKVPRFTAYHLRHTAATFLRDELGIEAAQSILGHRHMDMTAHYSISSERKAIETAEKLG